RFTGSVRRAATGAPATCRRPSTCTAGRWRVRRWETPGGERQSNTRRGWPEISPRSFFLPQTRTGEKGGPRANRRRSVHPTADLLLAPAEPGVAAGRRHRPGDARTGCVLHRAGETVRVPQPAGRAGEAVTGSVRRAFAGSALYGRKAVAVEGGGLTS